MIKTYFKDGRVMEGCPDVLYFNIKKPYLDVPVSPAITIAETEPSPVSEIKKIRYYFDGTITERADDTQLKAIGGWEFPPVKVKYKYLREDLFKLIFG